MTPAEVNLLHTAYILSSVASAACREPLVQEGRKERFDLLVREVRFRRLPL